MLHEAWVSAGKEASTVFKTTIQAKTSTPMPPCPCEMLIAQWPPPALCVVTFPWVPLAHFPAHILHPVHPALLPVLFPVSIGSWGWLNEADGQMMHLLVKNIQSPSNLQHAKIMSKKKEMNKEHSNKTASLYIDQGFMEVFCSQEEFRKLLH